MTDRRRGFNYATLNSNHPRDGTPIYIAGNSLFFAGNREIFQE
jgi:hypothetical protein